MMENKYYTPDIEDIRVGYEGEAKLPSTNFWVCDTWTKFIIKEESIGYYSPWTGDGSLIDDVYTKLGLYEIRTPYLTAEQIEAEGWKIVKNYKNNVIFEKIFGYLDEDDDNTGTYYELTFLNRNLYIYRYFISYGKPERPYPTEGDGNCIYSGNCLSINEFRTIMKLLNIK